MNKPEFTKPFDVKHAKAGAPFTGEHGEAVRVLIWDRKHPTHPIIAIEEDGEQEAIAFSKDGSTAHNYDSIVRQLVMLPLGFIDGKPVFVGDEYLGHADFPSKAEPKHAGMPFNGCKWPPAAPKWPQTTMKNNELSRIGLLAETGEIERRLIANAAIAHSCETGALVPADRVREISAEAYAQGSKAARDPVAIIEAVFDHLRAGIADPESIQAILLRAAT